MILTSFKAENFRGFVDTGHIALRPINLLVGRNSIGKSSFARIWPILNQGAKLQKRSPIMWNGDLVDFGGFKNVLSRHSDAAEVIFEFKMQVTKLDASLRSDAIRFGTRVRHLSEGSIILKISLAEGKEESSTFCTEFAINICGIDVVYKFDKTSQLVEVICQGIEKRISHAYTQERSIGFLMPLTDFFIKSNENIIPAWSPQRMELYDFLRDKLHGRLADERIFEICGKLNVCGSADELLNYCQSLPYYYKTWEDFIETLSGNSAMLTEFHRRVILSASEMLIRDMDSDLKRHFSAVNYIRPLRATAQRYYRKQELAVDNIDSDGANLAFFLASLSENRLAKLNKWLSETLDVNVKLDGEQGHVMVKLHDINTGRTDNMADMGFGFSQVLPLAVQAWISSRGDAPARTGAGEILVWEQPELHLHPGMQRRLARLIVKTISAESRRRVRFVIETHSQSIINEIGDMIIENPDLSRQIQVLLFDQENEGATTISTTKYDSEGQLMDWPLGFLTI
jgi:predicted ATPase